MPMDLGTCGAQQRVASIPGLFNMFIQRVMDRKAMGADIKRNST
jgi:hypothetical protein